MWIKGFLVLILLLIVAFQALFVIGFGGHFGSEQEKLLGLYHAFGVEISNYTLWVLAFARTKFALLLPLISLGLGFWAIYQKTAVWIISVLLLLGVITLALYAGVYLPSYLVVTTLSQS